MKKIELRPNGTKRVCTVNLEKSKTDGSFKEECDTNNIIAKFNKTGQLTHIAKRQGNYADVSEITDLHTAFIHVKEAKETFQELPAILRKKFNNSPTEFIAFLEDPKNDEEAVQLGLKVKINNNPTKQNVSAGAKTKTKSKPKNDDELNDDE